jgi:hypothetical protein
MRCASPRIRAITFTPMHARGQRRSVHQFAEKRTGRHTSHFRRRICDSPSCEAVNVALVRQSIYPCI